MLPSPLVSDVVSHAARGGASFAELYVERWKRRMLRVLNGEVKEATSGLEYGAGVRLFYGTEVAYAYTNDLTPHGLLEVVDNLARLKGTAGTVDSRGRGGLDFRRTAARGLHAPAVGFERHPKRYRLERLREADAGARVGPELHGRSVGRAAHRLCHDRLRPP